MLRMNIQETKVVSYKMSGYMQTTRNLTDNCSP
jgi:hypothetical protein